MPTTAACSQQLETQGFTVIENVVSSRQRGSLRYADPARVDFLAVRRLFEGLPMRVMEGLAGPMVLSQVLLGATLDWHRGRVDTLASGAPATFVPGFDVGLMLDDEPGQVDVIPGSARIADDAVARTVASASVAFSVDDVVVFDSRMLRRWPAARLKSVYWYSVIRPWMTPLMDVFAFVPAGAPPRAAAFVGRQPSRDVGEWLLSTHPRRTP